jgi:vacuolar-type H+-ATPase subunit I/STV1
VVEAGFLHLFLGLALEFIQGSRDRIERVGLAVEEEGVLFQLVAAEAVSGRRIGQNVQWLGVGVKEPAVF